jgi:plasmid stability protein
LQEAGVAQILVRRLPDTVVDRLKARAQGNSNSLEAEVRAILEQAVTKEKNEFFKAADAMRARLAGQHHTETLDLLREDRDR